MKLKLKVAEKEEASRMILIGAIGLLVSLENNLMTVEACKQYLFNPASVRILAKEGIDSKVIEIIDLCCAFEKIEDLANVQELKYKAKECLRNLAYNPDLSRNMKWLYSF